MVQYNKSIEVVGSSFTVVGTVVVVYQKGTTSISVSDNESKVIPYHEVRMVIGEGEPFGDLYTLITTDDDLLEKTNISIGLVTDEVTRRANLQSVIEKIIDLGFEEAAP